MPVEALEATQHGRWALPSVAHLRRLMRWAQRHPAEAKRLGAAARERMVERFSPSAVVRRHLLPLLVEGHGEL